MAKLEFDSEGRFAGVDGVKPKTKKIGYKSKLPHFSKQISSGSQRCKTCGKPIAYSGNCFSCSNKNKSPERKFNADRSFENEERLETGTSFETPFEKPRPACPNSIRSLSNFHFLI